MLLFKSKDPKTTVICLHNLSLDDNQAQICQSICNTTTMFDLILILKNRFGQNKKIYLYTSRINLFNGDLNTYVWNILAEENLKTIYFQIEDIQCQYDQKRINNNQSFQQSSINFQLGAESTNNRTYISQLNSQTKRYEDILIKQTINAHQNDYSQNESNIYQTDNQIQLQDGTMNGNQNDSDIWNDFQLLQKQNVILQSKFKTFEKENQKLKKQNEELQKVCDEQKQEIQNLRSQLEINQEDLNIQSTQQKDQIINLTNENLNLKKQIQTQQENEKIFKNNRFNQFKEIQDLNKQIIAKDDEINKLKEQLQTFLNRNETDQPKAERQKRGQKVGYQQNVNSTQLNQKDNQGFDYNRLDQNLDEEQIKKQSKSKQQQQQQQKQFQEIAQKEQTVQQQKSKLIIQEVEQKDEYLTQCGHKVQSKRLQSEIRAANYLKRPPECPQCYQIIDLEQLYNQLNSNVQLETTMQKSEDPRKIQKV
ncbi:unnamed protein product [Paramecium octaurelia]|uniref:Uncharacterized protein n=1 Tax=Paramecium octaurelia TaxID=43137 RepID=A0A8S1U3Q9_PAROT|nr:unnamed protein product [Paramecium octaurelia]